MADMPKRVPILGVPIDAVSMKTALSMLRAFCRSETAHHVMTPNPEMLVRASMDQAFRAVLQRSALNLPDGVGILWAARFVGSSLPERVTGVDVLQALCSLPDPPPIFLLGAAKGIAERCAQMLREASPNLRIVGTYAGSPSPDEEAKICERIRASGAQVLFVAFGAPAQDLWIDRVLPSLPGIRVAMGVGGAFDFIAGIRSRAPAWMRRIGLEWLWRLVQEPSRLGRILTATVIFPLLVYRASRRGDLPA